jgi:hypothetical protein
MRRGSLVFPLILIVIGVLFLLNNFNPELRVFTFAGRYWPFLLIGWGALRRSLALRVASGSLRSSSP